VFRLVIASGKRFDPLAEAAYVHEIHYDGSRIMVKL
jgi:hypothetical protein